MSEHIVPHRQTDRQFSSKKKEEVWSFLLRQLRSLYGVSDDELSYLKNNFDEAIFRAINCFSHINNKYYVCDEINVLHTGQYFAFLYYLSNTIYRNEV